MSSRPLCRYFMRGNCIFGRRCRFSHEAPTSPQEVTIFQKVNDMENRLRDSSKDKSCGICLDVVMEKERKDRKFGILPNCTHIYCFNCIKKWRQSKSNNAENNLTKCCPECRVYSEFICPSFYFAEGKEDKDMIINNYRTSQSTKDCRFFRKGNGRCPFGNQCFYKHARPNGALVDVGPPPPRRRRSPSELNLESLVTFIHGLNLLEDLHLQREDHDDLYDDVYEDFDDVYYDFDDFDDVDIEDSDYEYLFMD